MPLKTASHTLILERLIAVNLLLTTALLLCVCSLVSISLPIQLNLFGALQIR